MSIDSKKTDNKDIKRPLLNRDAIGFMYKIAGLLVATVTILIGLLLYSAEVADSDTQANNSEGEVSTFCTSDQDC